jgi:hypothetical protein
MSQLLAGQYLLPLFDFMFGVLGEVESELNFQRNLATKLPTKLGQPELQKWLLSLEPLAKLRLQQRHPHCG